MKRLVAAAGLITLFAAPAQADLDVEVTYRHPGPGTSEEEIHQWTPESGATLRGAYKLVVDASAESGLATFSLTIEPEDSGVPPPGDRATVSRRYPLDSQKVSDRIELIWRTPELTPFNARYRLVAKAGSQIGAQDVATISGLAVDNPPSPPKRVTLQIAGGRPVIRWDRGPEPDLLGYAVYRSLGAWGVKRIAFVNGTRFEDSGAPKGVKLTYAVAAVRRSIITPEGIFSGAADAGSVRLGRPIPVRQLVEIEAAGPPASAHVAGLAFQRPGSDLGFGDILPYSSSDLAHARAIAEEKARQRAYQWALSERLGVNDPLPFGAAAFVLLALAIHVGRASTRLQRPSRLRAHLPPARPGRFHRRGPA